MTESARSGTDVDPDTVAPATVTDHIITALYRECPRCYNEISDPEDVACDICGTELPPVPAEALTAWRAAENERHARADIANYGTLL